MSPDTPRTDDFQTLLFAPQYGDGKAMLEFARDLEREINLLKSQLADLHEGRTRVLPKTEKHAREMVLVAEACVGYARTPAVRDAGELFLWRVRYDSRFESSSGTDTYHIDSKNNTGLIATREEHLDAVRQAIRNHIGQQSRMTELHEAHFLGRVKNYIP